MAVTMPREKWTDERLDDLNKKVDEGFARVEGQVKDLRSEMNARFTSIEARFADGFTSIEGRFASIDGRFASIEDRLTAIESRLDALNRNLTTGLFVLIAAVIGSNAF